MPIIDDLLNTLQEDYPIRSIFVGAHWTAVSSRGCGLASTILPNRPHPATHVRDAGSLLKKSALELAQYARSDDPLEASIGVAAINSLLPVNEENAVEMNASEVLASAGKDSTVALVGHFPFIPTLREKVKTLLVIEQHPGEGEYPSGAAGELIPTADIVALTGSCLINHTMDSLLALSKPGAVVMILGPSTPLSPLLFNYGVTYLSGSIIVDEEAVLRTVSQGANFKQVKGVRLITMQKNRN